MYVYFYLKLFDIHNCILQKLCIIYILWIQSGTKLIADIIRNRTKRSCTLTDIHGLKGIRGHSYVIHVHCPSMIRTQV